MHKSIIMTVRVLALVCAIGLPKYTQAVSIDIFYLVDASGDMSSILPNLKVELHNTMALASVRLDDVAFGTGYYIDFLDPPFGSGILGLDFPFQLTQQITTHRPLAEQGINRIPIDHLGGGDIQESNLYALHSVATDNPVNIGWRPNSVKVIFWYGNNPGHDGDLEPAYSACCTDVGLSDTINALTGDNIIVYSFGLATPTSLGLDSTGQATAITSATGGAHYDIELHNILTTHSTVYETLATIPVPGAIWLFGTGLIGLIGIARRKKA